jgi:hyperosmotically inducible periplasmic protein
MRNWIVVGALASAVSVGACQRGPDVEKMAEGALQSVALEDKVDAKFDEPAGVVRLSGTVDSADQRVRAADAVKASIGSRAQVANEIVVEGAHAKAADDLDAGIQERFETLMENSTDIDGSDVDLRVANGVATLTGTVRTDAERTKVEGLVRSIPGVNSVVNTVTVERARDRKPDTKD